MSKREPQ